MSVWVQLSTQSAMPMVTGTNPPGAPAGPVRLRAPRLSMLDSTGSRMSRVGSPERRDSSFPLTWKKNNNQDQMVEVQEEKKRGGVN